MFHTIKHKFNTTIISPIKTYSAFKQNILLFPYIREIFVYPIIYLLSKRANEKNVVYLFNSTTTLFLSRKANHKRIIYVHALFSYQTNNLKKLFSNRIIIQILKLIEYIMLYIESRSLNNADHIMVPKNDIIKYLKSKIDLNSNYTIIPQFLNNEDIFNKKLIKKYDIL